MNEEYNYSCIPNGSYFLLAFNTNNANPFKESRSLLFQKIDDSTFIRSSDPMIFRLEFIQSGNYLFKKVTLDQIEIGSLPPTLVANTGLVSSDEYIYYKLKDEVR